MKLKFIVRLGDSGDYEAFDTMEELAEHLDACRIGRLARHCKYGVTSPGYEGHNYISLYVGDSITEPTRNLTDQELNLLNNRPVQE